MSTILEKIKSVKLCLMAHPDNEVDSEFADRISDLEEIENELSKDKWIKIEKEEDLPEETGTYFTYSKVWWKPFYRIDVFTGRLKNSFTDGKSCFTHYQQIIKPDLPPS